MTDETLINDIRDIIYEEGQTSRTCAERIIRLVRAHDEAVKPKPKRPREVVGDE